MIDQFAEGVDAPIDELHVMAPFYDHGRTRSSSRVLLIDELEGGTAAGPPASA
jgi:hypothetical protein